MSDLSGQTTQQLFTRWRGGDAEAGQAMAQRFSDWYYAISASRLGDSNCRPALERACQRFAQGVASVTEGGKLASWAHEIIAEEIQMAGGRVAGGDHPNALTNHRSPTELLQQNQGALNPDQVALLAAAYDPNTDVSEVKAKATSLGGYPLAVLEARYALKRHLRDHDSVGFTEIPERPNLDWGPLPLYEGGRMAEGKEETAFETWMLSDITLCKDIAEFAAFALALRGGAFSQASSAAPTAASPDIPRPVATGSNVVDEPSSGGSGGKIALVIGGLFLAAVACGGLALVASFFLPG